MRKKLLSKSLSLLLALLMAISPIPTAAFASGIDSGVNIISEQYTDNNITISVPADSEQQEQQLTELPEKLSAVNLSSPLSAYAAEESVNVDIIIAKYDSDEKGWEILYPDNCSTSVTVTSQTGTPTLLGAMTAINPNGEPAYSHSMIGNFFGLSFDSSTWAMWWYSIDEDDMLFNDPSVVELESGSQIIFYYTDGFESPTWDELAALISSGSEIEEHTEETEQTIDINVIVALNGYDGWQILYPAKQDGSTEFAVPFEGENAVVFDAAHAIDADYTVYNTTGIGTLLGQARQTNGGGNWNCAKRSGGSGSLTRVTGSFAATAVADGDYLVFYCSSSTSAPAWDTLTGYIGTPNPTYTPEQRIQNLIEANCSWDKIKSSNTGIDAVTVNLASLPSSLDNNALRLSWSTNGSPYMSDSGAITSRPDLGEQPTSVALTLSIQNGLMANTAKYGDYPDYTPVKTYEINISPLSQAEIDANKPSVQAALDGILLENLKLMDGEALDPLNVLYDIQLADPRQFGDKTTSSLSDYWSSDNPGVIAVNYMRAKVTRPALGQPDETVKLTVSAAKGGYTESKEFTVTVKAVTQAELDAANAELDAVAMALTFDVIKNANISADAVTSSLQMVYRGLSYPNALSWTTANSGEKGIKIEWQTSDASTAASYGAITRPSAADKNVTMTATLTAHRLAAYLTTRTVEVPIIVRKVSNSANVSAISLSPSMGFTFDTATKSYNLSAPSMAKSVEITVTTAETGTLITSGQHSVRGTLTFTVPLNAGQTTGVTINTEALDSVNTDTYSIRITRQAANGTDAAVSELLASIADSYKNTSGDWTAMDMAAYGMASDVAGKTIVDNARGAYASDSVTDIERYIIALTSLGVNTSNVYGGSESVYLNFIQKLGIAAPSQTMEAIYGLLALDSGDYSDNGLKLTRQVCINFLLGKKLTPAAGQAAWGYSSSADVDTTAMVAAALAPYYGSNPNVKTAVNDAFKYLSVQQNNSGHYGNSNSTSMVIVALTTLGKDPGANTGDFAKNGNSLIDGLLAFKTSSNRFGYDNTTANTLSTEQGFRALVAYRGYLYEGKSAYSIYRFGVQTGDGTALTGETDPGVNPIDPSAPKNITVRIENLYTGTTLMPKTSVKLSGTHLDALKAALTANGKNPATDLTESYGYISAILGISGGPSTGWMYAINGEIPVTMLSETQVAEGDSLVMFFIDWSGSFYFTMFDKTTTSVKTGESVTLTLTGINPWDAMGGGGTYTPLSGATVYLSDASGNRIGTSVVTGSDGKATLTFPSAGTYTVSAARHSALNATDLVPPLCTVTVTSSGTPSNPDPNNTMTVYFTLRGLSGSGNEETWINGKAVAGIAGGATVSDIIIKALEGTGYTQAGAANGYVKSVTTPNGFTLSEMYNGLPDSGWLFKVNSQLPTVGMDSYTVKNGDQVLLYFTKDYTKDPDASKISGGSSSDGAASVTGYEIEVKTGVKEGVAVAMVDSSLIKDALKDALDKREKSNDKDTTAEVKIVVTGTTKTSNIQIEIKAESLKAIADAKNVRLTIESEIATLTFDEKTLAGIIKGTEDNSDVKFVVQFVDILKLDNETQKTVGNSTVFDLSVMAGDTTIHNFDGTATVFLPFAPAAGTDPVTLTVYYLDSSGNPVPMENARYDAERKGYVFTTTHFSMFFISAVSEAEKSTAEESFEWTNPFADVKEGNWYYDAVKYASINNLMTGTAADKFSPDSAMIRAELVTVLYRIEGEPAVTGTSPFTDADGEQWYTNAVIWAYENGIVAGYDNGLFGTNDNVTREQAVTILKNYAQNKGFNVSKTIDFSGYSDTDEISPWALDSMKWAKAEGLIHGRSETALDPKGTATRAEIATILMHYFEKFVLFCMV